MTPEEILRKNELVKKLIQHPLFKAQYVYWCWLNASVGDKKLNLAEYMTLIERTAMNYFHQFYSLPEKTQLHAMYNAGAIIIQEMHSKVFASGSLQVRS